jgi:hypothetical protein
LVIRGQPPPLTKSNGVTCLRETSAFAEASGVTRRHGSKTARQVMVELTPEQAKTLAAELRAIGFTMPYASEK